MSRPTSELTLRLRLPCRVLSRVGLIAVMAAVGALFPAVGHSIGRLDVPKSVSNLLGGADYATITGWFRSEIASIYGPLVIAGARDHRRRGGHGRRGGGPDHVARAGLSRSAARGWSPPRPPRSPPSS